MKCGAFTRRVDAKAKDGADFSEAAFQQILERAMQLDNARHARISTADIRAISRELGISERSIERAIAEDLGKRLNAEIQAAVQPSTSSKIQGLSVILGLGCAFLMSGAERIIPYTESGLIAPVASLVLQACGLVIAVRYRGAAKHERFQLANLLMWLAVGAGKSFLDGRFHIWLPKPVLIAAIVSGLAGSAAIWLRDRIGLTSASGGDTTRSGILENLRNRVSEKAKSVEEWFRWFMQVRGWLDVARATSKSNNV